LPVIMASASRTFAVATTNAFGRRMQEPERLLEPLQACAARAGIARVSATADAGMRRSSPATTSNSL
jgi:hypothetical protein